MSWVCTFKHLVFNGLKKIQNFLVPIDIWLALTCNSQREDCMDNAKCFILACVIKFKAKDKCLWDLTEVVA